MRLLATLNVKDIMLLLCPIGFICIRFDSVQIGCITFVEYCGSRYLGRWRFCFLCFLQYGEQCFLV
ncbi:hypothetical protein C0J52_02688 [Blattella germanica]|nr:hypothetical protein C0J52_02688 [Blattella germanica]